MGSSGNHGGVENPMIAGPVLARTSVVQTGDARSLSPVALSSMRAHLAFGVLPDVQKSSDDDSGVGDTIEDDVCSHHVGANPGSDLVSWSTDVRVRKEELQCGVKLSAIPCLLIHPPIGFVCEAGCQ